MKGIMFRDDMLKAIEEGRKTVTRREFAKQPPKKSVLDGQQPNGQWQFVVPFEHAAIGDNRVSLFRARYKKGEIVYIKEPYDFHTFSFAGHVGSYCPPYDMQILYKAIEPDAPHVKWRNKMFMPAKYARNYVLITDVRAEQLRMLDFVEALCEGFETPKEFIACWRDMYGKDSWERDKNNWVWRIEFKPILTGMVRKVVK